MCGWATPTTRRSQQNHEFSSTVSIDADAVALAATASASIDTVLLNSWFCCDLLVVGVAQPHIVDIDIDLGHFQTSHAPDLRRNVAANRLGHIRDGYTVFDDEVEIDGGLALADLHLAALCGTRSPRAA